MGGNKAVFLDRDGTINKDKHYLFQIDDFEYLPGAVEGMKALSEMGYMLVIITNQSGIARGYFTEEDYANLDEWMRSNLLKKGVVISGSYYCPHLPEGKITKYAVECNCRKPKTGLFWKAAKELNIDMDNSYAIGDKERDLAICMESGVRGILLSNQDIIEHRFYSCADWKQIVQKIKSYEE